MVRALQEATKPAVTFNSIADEWQDKRLPMLHISSQFIIPARLRLHVRPFFGEMAVEDIRTGVVNTWIRKLSDEAGLEPKTIRNCWTDFRSVVNWYCRQLDKPKVSWYPDLPKLPDREQRWFTQEEANQIINAAKGQYRVLFHLAARTGMRCGELCALRVEDLKLDHGVIEVTRSVWHGIEGPTKTKAGKRTVYLDSEAACMLRQYLAGRQTGRVFQSRAGRPLVSTDITQGQLKPIYKRLGIAHGGMHAFRHGRVSHMRVNAMPDDFVTSQVGHSSLRITSQYTHFEHKQKREMAERLPSCTQNGNLYSTVN